MADQRPWWKLWVSALHDDDLQALSLEDWARWAMLGAHLKLHGEGGAMTCRRPGQALAKLWRTPRWTSAIAIARRLPGVVVTVVDGSDDNPTSVVIRMTHWKKYQDDTSRERMRALRDRKKNRDGVDRHDVTTDTVTNHHESDGVEEKRGRRDSPYPPSSPSPTNGQPTRYDWPSLEVKAASLRPGASGWLPGRYPYEAFHHDCPIEKWRGHCVQQGYADAHPDGYPTTSTGAPKQCPAHLQVTA